MWLLLSGLGRDGIERRGKGGENLKQVPKAPAGVRLSVRQWLCIYVHCLLM